MTHRYHVCMSIYVMFVEYVPYASRKQRIVFVFLVDRLSLN